jgi:hypothetical protein
MNENERKVKLDLLRAKNFHREVLNRERADLFLPRKMVVMWK